MAATKWGSLLERQLNFFRIHLTLFTLVPIIVAGILSASSGAFSVKYIDALFLCVSAMTGTALVTVDLSALTPWQQVIVLVISFVGSPIFVSLLTVYMRRRYLRKHLYWALRSEFERARMQDFARTGTTSVQRPVGHAADDRKTHVIPTLPVSTSRIDTETQFISSTDAGGDLRQRAYAHRSQAQLPDESHHRHGTIRESHVASVISLDQTRPENCRIQPTRRGTVRTINPQHQDDHFGGFGVPFGLFMNVLHRFFPSLKRDVRRVVTTPLAPVLFVSDRGQVPLGARPVSYLRFHVRVGHNSRFIGLSDNDFEELGSMEYRALTALLWIVPGYYFVTLLIPFAVLGPYMSIPKWKSDFLPPNQHRAINPIWYSAFQVVSTLTNAGFSLVDQDLVPFQTAYPLLIFMIWSVFAGSTGFPIFLRFYIWIIYKLARKGSQWRDTLNFLLDHPRRCFIYLFPWQETWFLLTILTLLNLTDWFFFLVLNIGIPTFDSIPVGRRVLLGLVQAASLRFAGFQCIKISVLAPAQHVLYLVLMYIAPYPISMNIRSTNVYEERALGILEDDENDDMKNEADDGFDSESRISIWGRYLGRHLRRQLSYDMWWLALALFLICIAERGQLMNPENWSWFTIFAVLFEIVSAYSTVGLSLGVPTKNYSLSGAMSTFSKLVICVVMMRGKHSGLPVALDKAIMFPTEFERKTSEETEKAGIKVAP